MVYISSVTSCTCKYILTNATTKIIHSSNHSDFRFKYGWTICFKKYSCAHLFTDHIERRENMLTHGQTRKRTRRHTNIHACPHTNMICAQPYVHASTRRRKRIQAVVLACIPSHTHSLTHTLSLIYSHLQP